MIDGIIKEIQTSQYITLANSFIFAKKCLTMFNSKETEAEAQKIIIYMLDNWSKINIESRQIWIDMIESIGFYPYLEKYNDISCISQEIFTTSQDVTS